MNDMTAALLAQVRKNRPGHIHHAPEVSVDLPLEFIGGHFLERTQEAVASVIDEHIDSTESFHRGGDGFLYVRRDVTSSFTARMLSP